MQLPVYYRQSIEDIVREYNARHMRQSATTVSQRYRRGDTTNGLQIKNREEAAAYLATRFPATFCATTQVMRWARLAVPDFSPRRLLDIGAGPGTATLAALQQWPELQHAALLEQNENMRSIGQALGKELPLQMEWHGKKAATQNILAMSEHDMVVISYMLNELAETNASDFHNVVAACWEKAGKWLVVVEPGTPHGQNTVLKVRDQLLAMGAHMVAPCPHNGACPLTLATNVATRWCHFTVRVERSKTHLNAKADATRPYEDEPFSFVVLSKNPCVLPWARLIGAPRGTKLVNAEACVAEGRIERLSVPKSHHLHASLRSAEWGDALDEN